MYQNVLAVKEPDREMLLAVTTQAFADIFTEDLGKLMLERSQIKVLVFDPEKGEIAQWIS